MCYDRFAHGIAYVAAPLLLYLGEEETFWALQLLYRRSLRYPAQEPETGLLRQVPGGDLTSMRMRVFQFERLMATHLPTVCPLSHMRPHVAVHYHDHVNGLSRACLNNRCTHG